jgi:phosphatidate cytidylyltransferase
MAPTPADGAAGVLRLRIVWGVALAVVALCGVALGGWLFTALVALAVAAMAREWTILAMPTTAAGRHLLLAAALAVPVLALVLVMAGDVGSALAIVLLGAALGAGLAALVPGGMADRTAAGVLYLGLPAVALVWLRADPEKGGGWPVLWLLLVVWATDVTAFAVGRTVGGPRLAPAVSPGKTWSGLAGGIVGAMIVGGLAGRIAWGGGAGAALLAGILAVVAQIGDLGESLLKRRAGVKDSGHLIPGHGGALDRLDGLLFAAPAFAGVVALAAPGALH